MDVRRKINERAVAQHGLITTADLVAAGATRAVRRRLVSTAALEPVGRRTFRVGGSPDTPGQRVLAACLDTSGVASHVTAAALHGLPGFAIPDVPDVTIVRGASRDGLPFAVVHSTTWLPADHVVRVDGIPCLNVARTLFSLAGMVPVVPQDQVKGAVDLAVADRKASDPWLWWMLERLRCRGRSGVTVFEAILADRVRGVVTESWLEREFLRVLEAAGVERPECQRRIQAKDAFVARVDFVIADLGIVIEVSGHAWHHTRAQRDADTQRRRQLVLQGFLVLEFTYDDVVARPEAVVAAVVEALLLRRCA